MFHFGEGVAEGLKSRFGLLVQRVHLLGGGLEGEEYHLDHHDLVFH